MTYAPALDTVVSREASWLTTTTPQQTLAGVTSTWSAAPVLLASGGGAFDIVQGYYRKVLPRDKAIYLTRTKSIENRISYGGEKQWVHHLLARVLWSFTTNLGSLETEMQNLDTAVAALVTRLRGPTGDKTHGGAFVSVGEGEPNEAVIDVDWGDSLQQIRGGGPLEVYVRYVASDWFPA